MTSNRELFERARSVLPGGVSSPARAFGAVGGDPLLASRAEGGYLYDAEGRRYIDLIQGFGAVILGHAHPAVTEAVRAAAGRGGTVGLSTPDEVRLAELVRDRVPTVERVRFVASGTEAGMTAARLARGATGRPVIVKFEGCYHGHADSFLAKAGSGVATFAVPGAIGVPEASVADTVVLPYNDHEALGSTFVERGGEIAAVFIEPVAANMGVVLPSVEFLLAVISACREAGSLAVFDEVVTGFRLGPGGAQEQFLLEPDLTMLGKVLGGGLPVGALGGRAELMDLLAPSGDVYQAGTYAAHPHAMAAGAATLESLTRPDYERLEATVTVLADGLTEAAKRARAEVVVVRAGTILSVFFTDAAPRNFSDVQSSDRDAFARFHRSLREQGVLVPPSPFEAWFVSLAHTPEDIERVVSAARAAFADVTD